MQVLASQLHFLANKNPELAIPPLFWPVNCIKIGGHVALLSDPTVYSLYCGFDLLTTVEIILAEVLTFSAGVVVDMGVPDKLKMHQLTIVFIGK